MRKTTILFAVLVVVISSCTQQNQVKVTYETTSAISEYNLYYMTPEGDLTSDQISPESAQDVWKYSYFAEEGDIVYVSGKYGDINSALKIIIKVDGKIYKQASNEGDTLKFLTVSGVVPYK